MKKIIKLSGIIAMAALLFCFIACDNSTTSPDSPNIGITVQPTTPEATADDSIGTLTPIDPVTFTVKVGGFLDNADALAVGLDISLDGVSFKGHDTRGNAVNGVKTFTVTVSYNGVQEFPSGTASIIISGLTNLPADYTDSHGTINKKVTIIDGHTTDRAIPVNAANVGEFNTYARSANGLKRHYKLTENVTLNPPQASAISNWREIGSDTGANGTFSGSFDGQGNTITGLVYNNPNAYFQGMFGCIGVSGIVKNTGLVDCSIGDDYEHNGRARTIGGIAGRSDGIVENCYTSGSVSGGNSLEVGGVVGENRGTVINCYSTCDIYHDFVVGGIVGENYSYTTINGMVINCYFTGSIEGKNTIGGIAGRNYSAIENCYSTGSFIGSGDYVGGIAGVSNGTLINCYSTGSVEGKEQVGGITGRNDKTLKDCYSTGNIKGIKDVGGIAGRNDATIETCYSLSSITGKENVGGIVGLMLDATINNCVAFNKNLTVEDSYFGSIGRITGNIFGTFTNNYAWSGMTIMDDDNPVVPVSGANLKDGVDLSKAQLKAQAEWVNAGFSFDADSPWKWTEGKMPHLFAGDACDWPDWLADI